MRRRDLREGVKPLTVVDFASPSTIEAMPFGLYLDGLATRLDGAQAAGTTIHLNIEFTDTKAKWLLELEYGVLQYYEDEQAPDADVALTADEFRNLAEGKTTIDAAIKAGDIKLSGSQASLDVFLSLFITFDGWYNVVTPVEVKP